ncbi:hypothetical protein EST38_g3350 [Candolleomyces aberdarensis]|uniref:Nephrocystin 3-like N-terminal domain-containing protein n=1 Tax=Candolleomyces aberdarensis TaxID=2316362 RepID=A0A4Q2DUC1_9AGAR|nr:hypothetical protein EST38_g3350 [Candolleomyces aberdarensis]
MSSVSYFGNAKKFSIKNSSLNTFIANTNVNVLQYLEQRAASGAIFDSNERYPPPLCHPGTRKVALGRIGGWFGSRPAPGKGILWVHGPAGYGKSAIAQTVSENRDHLLEDNECSPVGATFFFWRGSPERNSPARFIITLAYQLAVSVPEILPFIEEAVNRDPVILKKALEIQLTRLIVEPFQRLDGLEEMPNRLVIIDGLDECINSDQEWLVPRQYAEERERVQIRILDLILTLNSKNFPLCFLILSRPEPWIRAHIESEPFKSVTETIDLYETEDHFADVEKYLRSELRRIAQSLDIHIGEKGEEWPGESRLLMLVDKTDGNMLYAATVSRHIDDPYGDPRRKLQDILRSPAEGRTLSSSPTTSLYELYKQIIRSCPHESHPMMAQVLADILASKYVFSPHTTTRSILNVMDRLYGRTPGVAMRAVRGLEAVLRPPDSTECGGFWLDLSENWEALESTLGGSWECPGRFFLESRDRKFFLHSSFPEFLESTDAADALGCAVDVDAANRRLVSKCLDCLSSIDLHGDIQDDHHIFAVVTWVQLWRVWTPSCEADLNATISKLLSIDVAGCIVQAVTLYGKHGSVVNDHYGFFHDDVPYLLCCSPLELQEHMASSVERALLHLLQPALLRPHCEDGYFDGLVETLRAYLSWLQKTILSQGYDESELREGAAKDRVFLRLITLAAEDLDLFKMLLAEIGESIQGLGFGR